MLDELIPPGAEPPEIHAQQRPRPGMRGVETNAIPPPQQHGGVRFGRRGKRTEPEPRARARVTDLPRHLRHIGVSLARQPRGGAAVLLPAVVHDRKGTHGLIRQQGDQRVRVGQDLRGRVMPVGVIPVVRAEDREVRQARRQRTHQPAKSGQRVKRRGGGIVPEHELAQAQSAPLQLHANAPGAAVHQRGQAFRRETEADKGVRAHPHAEARAVLPVREQKIPRQGAGILPDRHKAEVGVGALPRVPQHQQGGVRLQPPGQAHKAHRRDVRSQVQRQRAVLHRRFGDRVRVFARCDQFDLRRRKRRFFKQHDSSSRRKAPRSVGANFFYHITDAVRL